ncbi:hypothetical protein [Bradyrhizobium cenepequi]
MLKPGRPITSLDRGFASTVRDESAGAAIELRIDEASQLFDTLDPFPFRKRDLDKDAEDYIVGWARELPKDQPIRIIVHLPKNESESEPAKQLSEALTRYFTYRAEVVTLELKELFRIGRRSLMIGLTVLAICVIISQAVAGRFGSSQLGRFAEESLVIVGWVANWKPIELFLYDWWPLARHRNLYRRLAAATVELRPHAPLNQPETQVVCMR